VQRSGGMMAIIVSALALIFSAVSLYQTVIKQAQLHVYLPDTINYTRDPDGSFEVFVLPITVSNSGARDGLVSAMKLEVRNLDTGITKTLDASYFTSPGYFSTKEDITNNQRRPKAPFAPLSVAGRGSVSKTVLFYPREYEKERVVPGKGRYELKLSADAQPIEDLGALDQFWSTSIAPVTLSNHLPGVSPYFKGRMLTGHNVRMFREDQ
jgi:hypothetical protein